MPDFLPLSQNNTLKKFFKRRVVVMRPLFFNPILLFPLTPLHPPSSDTQYLILLFGLSIFTSLAGLPSRRTSLKSEVDDSHGEVIEDFSPYA